MGDLTICSSGIQTIPSTCKRVATVKSDVFKTWKVRSIRPECLSNYADVNIVVLSIYTCSELVTVIFNLDLFRRQFVG